MPLNQGKALNHYPEMFVRALRHATRNPETPVLFAECRTSREASIEMRRFRAMLKGLRDFPGQDGELEAAAQGTRLKLARTWLAQRQVVELTVAYAERPSEAAERWLASLKN